MADERIVIIDDESGIVSLCTRLLARSNYAVEGVSVPEEGLQLLRQEQYDLLLVDIRMPGMDGFEVIEQARLVQPDLAVVIMTGFGTLETAIRALRKGADGLILKPFESGQDLVRTVRDALQARKEKQEVSRLRAIRPLLNVTESLFAETRFEPLLALILETISEHLEADHAMIYQRKAGDSFLTLLAGKGRTMSEEHARASGGMAARAEHWYVPLWANQGGPGDAEFQQMLEEHGYSGAICIPIRRGEGSLVFAAARNSGQPAFHIADVETFGLLARQADIALENSRLYEELRDYIRQIEQSQRALIQAEKMSAVGRLTASIAHEVNNPLQAVQNCLHLGQRDELSSDKRTEYLEMAHEELDRLMSTVQRMLEFYRPGALEKSETDLANLVEKVLALLAKQMQNQGIEVLKEFQSDLPTVQAVGNQIQQVFFNLILNAMEVMAEGGKITISLRKTEDCVVAEFLDTGPGVDPAMASTIFEPFVSAGADGTGLGLSVSYGILTAHNGKLELVEDKNPGGLLPGDAPAGGGTMKGRILVVDDEKTMRKSLEEILGLEGYQVESVGDGKTAMERLDTNTYDLMLLDLKMPRVDGLEVLKFASEAAPDCKVIMLTAHGSMESAIQALRQGAHDYILKPAKPEELIASVANGITDRMDTERKQLLLAQMEASIQELRGAEASGEPVDISRTVTVLGKNVKIDLERREIWTSEEDKVQLTPTEGKLMQILLENRGKVLSHKDLVYLVQGYQTTDWEAPEIMRPLVSRLRRKLAFFEGGDNWIVNVRGTGYVFDGN